MSILDTIRSQTSSLDDLAALPQAMIMQMAQKGQIREDMLAPILGRKAELADAVARTKALQSQGQPMPTVMEQLMQRNAETEMPEPREMGVAQLPIREDMYQGMAGGGIVAFDEGGDVDEEQEDKDQEDYEYSMIESMMLKKPSMSGDYGIKADKKEEPSVGIKADGTPLGLYAMKVAEKYGVDPELASYVMKKETGGMKDPARAVSSAGAQGVMQLMPGTARDMGVKDSFDPYENIEGGIKYLAMLNKKYEDPKLVAIAYNWGPGNTDKWLKSGADVSKLPAETRKYIAQMANGGAVQHYQVGGGPVGIRSTLDSNEEVVDFPAPAVEDEYSFANYMQNLKRQRDAAKTDAEQDKYMALIAAGLGMMGGTSQYAGANIGAGGQKGLESLAQSKKLRAAESAALDKSELGALRAKGIEDLRRQEAENLKEYRKGQLEGKADKVLKDAEDKEAKLVNKVDGILNRDPVIRDFTKKMEMLTPDDPMYGYYLDEIEKRRSDAYKRAGLKLFTPSTKIGTPPAPVEEPGFFKKLFSSDKPKSGGTMKFDSQGNPI